MTVILAVFFLFSFNLDYNINSFFKKNRSKDMENLMIYVSKSAEKESYFLTINFYSIFKKNPRAFYITATSLLATHLSVYLLKGLIGRKRPSGEHKRWNSSFPSGHTAGAFAFANSFSKIERDYKFHLFTWALLVGFSRIYLGRHWFSDCVVGAGMGILISEIICRKIWGER